MRKILWCTLLTFLLVNASWASTCPSAEKLEQILKKIFPKAKNLKVEKIQKSPLSNLCEAIISTGGPFKNIFYVDTKGNYLLLGQLFSLKTGQNLTREKIIALSKLTPQQLERLETLVAFKEGKGKKEIYLVTDPDCPFCKRLEKVLQELINEEKITVKVIFLPLDRLHPRAKEKAIAIICDRKGFGELLVGYTSSNQCPEGKTKVEEAQKFLFSLGIRGTPVLILPDGRILQGAIPKKQLEKFLGISS